MKKYTSILLMSALFVVAGCTMEEPFVEDDLDNQTVGKEITIQATREDDPETRTVRDESDGSVWWTPGDAISLFYGSGTNGGSKFTSNATEISKVTNFTGVITAITGGGEIPVDATYFWGVYPYSEDVSCDGSSVTLTVPSQQTAVPGTFDTNTFPSIGRSQGLIMGFYNVCGGWWFTVNKEGVRKATLKSKNGEAVTGKVKVGFDASGVPEVREVIDGSDEVVLECPSGEYFEVGKKYYIVLLPDTFSEGFTITLETFTEEGVYNRTKATTITRSKFSGFEKIDDYLTTPFTKKNGEIPIEEDSFKEILVQEYDTDSDGEISYEEAETIETLEIQTSDIESISGIEYMPNLKTLICSGSETTTRAAGGPGQLTELDVTNNTELVYLDCSDNQISSLDVSNNPELETLICTGNPMSEVKMAAGQTVTNMELPGGTRIVYVGVSPIDGFDFQHVTMALDSVYSEVQYMVFGNQRSGAEHSWMLFGLGLDTFAPTNANSNFSNWTTLTADSGYARFYSENMYKLSNLANKVVDWIDEHPEMGYTNETVKNNLRAEAVFLRAWAFRVITGMFGQVVYSEHAMQSDSFDHAMIAREEAWEKIASDFEYAEENLPASPRALGSLTKAAAAHYLSETYLSLGQFAEAEAAASRVIGGQDGDYHLMTTRFGNRKNQTVDRYGNSLAAPKGAYWDLFRTSGMTKVGAFAPESNPNAPDNKEAIWVAQIDYQSGDSWWRMHRPVHESTWAPWIPLGGKNSTRINKDGERFYVFTADATCFPAGVNPAGAGAPASDIPEAQGRRIAYTLSTRMDSLACRTQGNGVSIGLGLYASEFVVRRAGDILGSYWDDPNDFRGSEVMVQRDYYTPSGKKWSEVKQEIKDRIAAHPDDDAYVLTATDTLNITPRYWKFSDDRHIIDDDNCYYDTDWYMVRIAETYLLRAEARLAQGNKSGAAEDINVLRSRAGARPCSAADIDIDYILDERVRELFGEEQRWITLSRLSCNPNATYVLDKYPTQNATTSNTLYERTRKYGFGYENDDRGREAYTDALGNTRHRPNIQPHNYVLPIPILLIQSNNGILIQQNYGY